MMVDMKKTPFSVKYRLFSQKVKSKVSRFWRYHVLRDPEIRLPNSLLKGIGKAIKSDSASWDSSRNWHSRQEGNLLPVAVRLPYNEFQPSKGGGRVRNNPAIQALTGLPLSVHSSNDEIENGYELKYIKALRLYRAIHKETNPEYYEGLPKMNIENEKNASNGVTYGPYGVTTANKPPFTETEKDSFLSGPPSTDTNTNNNNVVVSSETVRTESTGTFDLNSLQTLHPKTVELFALLDQIKSIAIKKSHDYAGDVDPMSNFRLCETAGIPAWKGIVVRLGDKLSRIMNFAKKGELKVSDESVEDTCIDLAAYSLLCLIMYREFKNKKD